MSFVRFLLLVMATVGLAAFDPEYYSDFVSLDQNYNLYWKVDTKKQRIEMALEVSTLGWIGIGIGEPTSGSMPGADIAIFNITAGKGQLTDYYAKDFVTPSIDTCQDWDLISFEQRSNVTIVELRRDLDTYDTQDREIVEGMNRVIFAYGSQMNLAFHGDNVGKLPLIFWEEDVNPPPADVQIAEYIVRNFTLPTQQITFVCYATAIPILPGAADQHIIQIDPIIDPATTQNLYSLLVHICDNTSDSSYVNEYFQNPGVCSTAIGNTRSGCRSVLYAWGQGGNSLVLPPQAGYRMGFQNSYDIAFMVLELHYNNPTLTNITDNSGFRIHYTPILRNFDAATIALGDVFLSFPPIPANISQVIYEASCPSLCTSKFSDSITVFSSYLQMGFAGKQIWTSQSRDSKFLRDTNQIDFYTFNTQQQTTVNFTIQPGDQLNTHCTYNTRNRVNATTFGLEYGEEICIEFLSYFPRLDFLGSDFENCGYLDGTLLGREGNFTICGSMSKIATGESILGLSNPSDSDVDEGLTILFGDANDHCKKLKTTTLIIGICVGFGLILIVIIGGIFYIRRHGSYTKIPEKVSLEPESKD